MIIKVNEKYDILLSQYGTYDLKLKRVVGSGKNKGEIVYTDLGYHSTLQQALRAIAKRDMMDLEVESVKLSEYIKMYENKIQQLIDLVGEKV